MHLKTQRLLQSLKEGLSVLFEHNVENVRKLRMHNLCINHTYTISIILFHSLIKHPTEF